MDSRKTALFEINLGMATCDGLTEPYLPAVLTICDLIEAGDVLPSVVLDCIKTKLESAKEQQALLGLQVLENIVKNCGGCIRDELTKKAYCDVFHNLARTASHNSVKRKLLELIKTWDCVFGEKPQHINLIILLNTMKADGFIFPNLQVSKAMLALYDAPRAIQKSDMTRKRKLESVPTPTQITSQSKLHKQEHFYFSQRQRK
ncbi:VHS domain [Popillia japonica]|uniref:VHS domain n=1 Tax=Popillia japonica TaxID=7064 RepID=A0AAW1JIM8_POPJA